jgi:sugar phosphate isomerase/epimerase
VMTSAWEIVAANTDPRYVHFEVDIYWAREAFGAGETQELLNFLKRYRDRIVLLHMKDMAPSGAVADLGHGTTNWHEVIDAAGPAVRYYIYEFDLPANPARSAQIGFEYLTCNRKGSSDRHP